MKARDKIGNVVVETGGSGFVGDEDGVPGGGAGIGGGRRLTGRRLQRTISKVRRIL